MYYRSFVTLSHGNALDIDVCGRCKAKDMTCAECMELALASKFQDCAINRISSRTEDEEDEVLLVGGGVRPWLR